jgi:carbon-monoxide dehydrogenase small subunit
MIMTAVKLVESYPEPTEGQIRHGLEGNLCRCTGYQNIVTAVEEGARQLEAHAPFESTPAEHQITLREAERRAWERSRT